AVRTQGDAALVAFTNRFDRRDIAAASELEIHRDQLDGALVAIEPALRDALEAAAQRIRNYHQHQKQASWDFVEADGTRLGQQVTPLDRVGVYVPGGKASYPSSVL